MHFLHSRHAFLPFTPAVFGIKDADGRGGVDLIVVSRMKDKLIDKGYMFFESNVVGEPMLSAVRTFVDGVGHRAGIDRCRELRIDCESCHTSCAETREPFPQLTLVARLIDGIVRGDIENVRVGRMQGDRDDCLALLLAAGEHRAEECGDDAGNRQWMALIIPACRHYCEEPVVRRSAGDLTIAVRRESRSYVE